MEMRKEINNKLVQWIKDKVNTQYADDISLVCVYGSYLNGTMNSKSDVDCYFIPRTERGFTFAVTFLLDGVGYDIFPMTWERLEQIANLRSGLQPLVGDAQILYCGNTDDSLRFQALQAKLKDNLKNDAYVQKIAADRCSRAAQLCASVTPAPSPSQLWKTAGQMIMTLADAVAIKNRDYYHFGLKKQFEDLRCRFPEVPESIADGYRNVIEADHAVQAFHRAKQFLDDVCAYVGADCAPHAAPEKITGAPAQPDAAALAELYQEICSTFNKIYVCCESGNHILAFLSAVCLQADLEDALPLGCPEYALLDTFHRLALSEFAETTRRIEKDLVHFIITNGGHIKAYDSFAQYEAAQ